YAGGSQEAPLRGSQRLLSWSAQQRVLDDRIAGEEAGFRKPLDESLRIVEVRILQSGTIQPERTARRRWECYIIVIPQYPRKNTRHEGSRVESNPHPLALCGTQHRSCPGFRSTQRQKALSS